VHVRDLSAALAGRGEEVIVLAGEDGILFEQLAERKVPFQKVEHLVHPIRLWDDWQAYWEIRSVLSKIRPDIVTTHSNKAGFLGRFAARSLKIPVVHTSHGFLFSGRQQNAAGRFYRLMEKIASGAGNRVIAVAEKEYTAASSLKVIAAEKMTVIHNGLADIDLNFIADPALDPPCLIMVARFAEPKDHFTLLKALGRLKQLPWTMQFVGDGPEKPRAEKLARELGIEERVIFSGVRRDVPAILAASQIFILSSKREGFPLTVLEAMRAGLPVVASNVGGITEAVVDETNGLLFAPGDIEQLKEKLKSLILNSQLRLEMGRAGRERFLKYFTLEQMTEKTLAVYSEIISEMKRS
jgi:glycosyltransferase involved in cell wall biosynthesis